METHAHHLHKAPGSKFWHYFFEFIMLFLAVFCGFVAENLREHVVEHHRERQYAKSLLDDLTVDTFTIRRTIDEKRWIGAKFDSAQNMLASGVVTRNNEFIYYVERYLTLNDVFSSQDVTYQQLRSSGNFRYIDNITLYKNIADYYNLYSRYQSVDGSFGIINKNALADLEAKIFDPQGLTSLDNYQGNNFYDLAIPADRKLKPISGDQQLLKSLYIHMANAKARSMGAVLLLGWLKEKATELMKELKKEYHLE